MLNTSHANFEEALYSFPFVSISLPCAIVNKRDGTDYQQFLLGRGLEQLSVRI